jgi:adenylosuccinate synthase
MGPFPTELEGEMGDKLRALGGEFGATTGRPRRCGWLDLVALKHAVQINGGTDIILTKVDVLSGLEKVQICTGYELASGEVITHLPWNLDLDSVKPVYEAVDGWDEDITGARTMSELPAAVRHFVDRVEAWIGKPISSVSVGPDREQTIPRSV